MPSSEGTSHDFRGVPGTLRSKMTGTTPAQSKPVRRARPMAAKQTAGLWTPAALGIAVCTWNHRLDVHDDVLEWDAAAAGFARAIRGVGGNFPRLVLQALPRARRRAAAKPTDPPPGGDKVQGGYERGARSAHL
jgi:hypothetical protein